MDNNSRLNKKVIISCFLAGCLEIYDFTIFGFLSPDLQKNFLNFLNPTESKIVTYALFAVGFIFRPLGALIFGYIGDKYGRKKSLVISVSLMGIASLVMAIIPTYNQIGTLSCYIIVLVRIVQGLSVGGEYSGIIIFAMEHSNKKYYTLVGSIVVSGCMSGVLLASLVSYVLKNTNMPSYGWRYAFLFGSGLAFLGYFIRFYLTETLNLGSPIINSPTDTMSAKKKIVEIFTSIFLAATNGVNLYFITIFLPPYLEQKHDLSFISLPVIVTISLVILIPLFSYLAEKIGKIRQITISLIGLSILNSIFLHFALMSDSYYGVLCYILFHIIFFGMQAGVTNTYIVEIFPKEIRYRYSAVSYSIGMGILGGSTPFLASAITANFGNSVFILSMYIASISVFSLIGIKTLGSNR
ncbi:MAG UNVERIFIED_CONTAM: MFS transporter [Rickettsiaceae bacterium]|jgi:MHS family proline/betaine transporter-like MFS transporter